MTSGGNAVYARVFCLASAKGGSGKTVIAASLAGFLSGIGKKCAVIDCDAATNGMTLMHLTDVMSHGHGDEKGLFDFLDTPVNYDTVGDSIVGLPNGVALLPATYNAKLDPESKFSDEVLLQVLRIMRSEYDVIFLDAQAGSDIYSRLCMSGDISDEVILVSEYDPLSAAGVERLKQEVGGDLGYGRAWVLLNKVLPEFVDNFSEFLSVVRYLPPIPWNAEVVRAYARRTTALDLDAGNEFTLAIKRTLESLMGDYIDADLESWLEERTYALKAPLEDQYKTAEMELVEAFRAKRELTRKNRFRVYSRAYLIASVMAGTFVWAFQSWSDPFTYVSPLSVATFVFFILASLYWITSTVWEGRDTAEGAKYDRRIERLKENLRQLEALRAANYEGVVRGVKYK